MALTPAERQRALRLRRIAQGVCSRCPAATKTRLRFGETMCAVCRDRERGRLKLLNARKAAARSADRDAARGDAPFEVAVARERAALVQEVGIDMDRWLQQHSRFPGPIGLYDD